MVLSPVLMLQEVLFKVSLEKDRRPVPSSNQLRVFGAFSRHLPKGMKRVEVSKTNPDLLVSAFTKGQDKTMIILNRGFCSTKS